MKGIFNFGGTMSPNKSASSAIRHKTLRTMSPKYIPEMIFSKICDSENFHILNHPKSNNKIELGNLKQRQSPALQGLNFQHPEHGHIQLVEGEMIESYPTPC